MLTPSTPQILKSISNACQTILAPAVGGDKTARSTLQTIDHMLRYVALRIEQEARVLTEDIDEISMLLKRIATYLDSTIAPAATAESLRISESLAWPSMGHATYTSVSSLVERAAAMNEALDSSLRYLQSIRSTHRGNAAYDEIRAEIRRYLRWQIEHEAQLVHPAFEGFGPRR